MPATIHASPTSCSPHRALRSSDTGGAAPRKRGRAAAANLGVSFELDVTLSEDGTLVVIHDDPIAPPPERGRRRDPVERYFALGCRKLFGAQWASESVPTCRVLGDFGHQVVIDVEIKVRLEPR